MILVKEEGSSINDGKMIFAANQLRFFKPHEIFSGTSNGKVYNSYKYDNYQVKITEQKVNIEEKGWFNYMGLSFGGGSEFHNYLNTIFEDPKHHLNKFIKRY